MMRAVLSNDASGRGAEQSAHQQSLRIALSEELQRMWKDVFAQSRIVVAPQSNDASWAWGDFPDQACGEDERAEGPAQRVSPAPAASVASRAARPSEGPVADAAERPAVDANPLAACSIRTRGASPRRTAAGVAAQSAARANANPVLRSATAMEMCASAPRLTNVAPSDTPSRAGEVSAAEGETVDVTVRPSLTQSLPTPVTSATSSLFRAPPHVTAQAPEAASARASVDTLAAHEPQPPADEVVQVFHNDGVVAIVIRDLALGDDVALRCALETARQLAGDPRALRQVTLNGRSIFRSADRTGATPAHRQPLVSFTC